MKSFYNLLAGTALAVTLTASVAVAQANVIKVALTSLDEIFSYVKKGAQVTARETKEVMIRDFNGSEGIRIIYMFGKSAKEEFIVAVTRAEGPAMIQMNIEIIQPLNASGKKLASEIPGTYRMHGEVTKEIDIILEESVVNAVGQRAMQNISKLDGLDNFGGNVGNLAFDLERSGRKLNTITFNEYSTVRLVDDIQGAGAGAKFDISLGIPKNATPEQIKALLDAVVAAM